MTALDFESPPQASSPLLVEAELVVEHEPLGDRELEHAASEVRADATLIEQLEHYDGTLLSLLGLLEGSYFDESKHPRWPAGTAGGLGGQFMHTGQRFTLHGVDYDVAQVLPGKIYANVATKGVKSKPATVEFSEKELAQAVRPPAEPIKGAKSDTLHMTATVLDPYVHPETHDPSIPIPASSALTPEQWQRFGKIDQEWYSNLMEKLGPWSAGAAQTKVNAVMKAADTASRQILESSYSSQFATSTGFTISLHGLWKNLVTKVKGAPEVEKTRTQYENARGLQAEAASVLQWDLYNRTLAPDIAIFHKHSDHALFENEIIHGPKPVFAGLSQSQFWREHFFGPYTFATPMAIRHVVMSTVSADMTGYSGMNAEQEVATADPFLADDRSLEVTQFSPMQAKWLTSITSNGKSASGAIIEMLKESMKDGGVNLPVQPSPPMIQMDGVGGKQYQTPPDDMTKFAMVGGAKVSVLDLPYANIVDGKPVAKKMKDMVESGEIQAGDYIEGMKGTRYIVVPDPSDAYLGLAYYKITDTGTPVAGTEMQLGGQSSSAFEGHKVWAGGAESYQFEGGGEKAWKKLAGHSVLPTLSEKATGFYPHAWSVGGPDDVKWMKDFVPGDKFMVGNTAYEVVQGLANGQKKIKNLTTGKGGEINGDTKLPKLVLKAGYTEGGDVTLDISDFLRGTPVAAGTLNKDDYATSGTTVYRIEGKIGDTVSLAQMSGTTIGKLHNVSTNDLLTPLLEKPPGWEPPQVGDTFAFEGAKATVTKILKDGTVQAKKQAGGVVKLKQNDLALGYLHRPSSWELGEKAKLKLYAPGEKFHGGTGVNQIRPYIVVAQQGKTTQVRNLDTGELMDISSQKTYQRLVLKQTFAAAPVVDHTQPPSPLAYNPDAWEPGPAKTIAQLELGDKFLAVTPQGAVPYEITAKADDSSKPDTWSVLNLSTGETKQVNSKFPTPLPTLVAKAGPEPAPAVDVAGLKPNGLPLSELPIGAHVQMTAGPNDPAISTAAVLELKKIDPEHGAVLTFVKPGLDKNGDPVIPTVSQISVDATTVFNLADPNPEPPSGLVPNVGGLTLSQLPVGARLQMATNPLDPTIAVPAVWKLSGFSGPEQALLEIVEPPVMKGTGTTHYKVGDTQDFSSGTFFDLIEMTPDTPSGIEPVSAEAFDASAYTEAPNKDPGTLTLGDMTPGEIFKGQKGGYYRVDSIKGVNVNATALATGKHTKFKATVKPAAVLFPKAVSKTPYADLLPGDPVALGDLQLGDQFTSGSALYEIVEPSGGIDEKNATVAVVKPGGQLGATTSLGGAPSFIVKLHAKKTGTVNVPPSQVTAIVADTDAKVVDLTKKPDAYASYKFHKSGAKKYPKLSTMAEDVIFHDAEGAHYKVKKAGPEPVVTDGEKLYKMNGDWRGFVVDAAAAPALTGPHGDTSPDPVDTHQEVEATLAAAAQVDNVNGWTIGQYDPSPGDSFVFAGVSPNPLKVTQVTPQGHVYAYDTKTGASHSFLNSMHPVSFSKQASMEGLIQDDDPEPSALPEIPVVKAAEPTAPGTPQENTLPLGALSVGTQFTMTSAYPGVVWEVSEKKSHGAKIDSKVVDPGTLGNTFKVGQVVMFNGGLIVPDKIGPAGSFKQAAAATSSLSSNIDDYEVTGKGLLKDAPEFIAPVSSPNTIYQVLGPADFVNGTKLKNLAAGTTFETSATMAVNFLKPKDELAEPFPGYDQAVSSGTSFDNDELISDQPAPSVMTYKEPTKDDFKDATDFPVGSVFIGSGYGGGVYRVASIEPANPNSPYSSTKVKATIVKPPSPSSQKVGDMVSLYGSMRGRPYEGGPMWKAGEYAKLIKPGNKTGKAVRVVGHDGNMVRVRYANGEEVTVEPSSLHGSNPVYGTKQKLAFVQQPISALKAGDIFKASNMNAPSIVTGIEGDTVKAHIWGGMGYESNETHYPSDTMVEPLVGARAIAAMQKPPLETKFQKGDKVLTSSGSLGTVKKVPTYEGDTYLVNVGGAYGNTYEWVPAMLQPYVAPKPKVGDHVTYGGEPLIVAFTDDQGLTLKSQPDGIAIMALSWKQWAQHGDMANPPQPAAKPGAPGDVNYEDLKVGDVVKSKFNKNAFKVMSIVDKGAGVEVQLQIEKPPYTVSSGYYAKGDAAHLTMVTPAAAKPPAAGSQAKLGTLKTGTTFALPQGLHPDEVWTVTAEGGSDAGYPDFVYAAPQSGGQALPFGIDVEGQVLSTPAGRPPVTVLSPDWQPNTATIAALKLPVGARFTHEGGVFEVIKAYDEGGPDALIISPKKVSNASAAGTETSFQPGTVPDFVWFPPSPAAEKLKAGLTSILEPGTKTPVGELAPFAEFYTDSTVGVPAGNYQVAPFDEGMNWGILPDGANPSAVVFARSLADGSKVWVGDTLAVEPKPSGTPLPGEKVPGETVGTVASVAKGDFFTTELGNTYEVLDAGPDQAERSLTIKLVAEQEHQPGAPTVAEMGKDWTMTYTDAHAATWKWAAPVASPDAGVAPAAGSLLGYAWHKSGKKTYPHIGALQPGTKFEDKSHKTFTVAENGLGGYVHYTDEAGQKWSTPETTRVYVVGGE